MTKEELWKKYTDRNPQFLGTSPVTMSAAGLRKFFEQTYDRGHEQGVANGRALERFKKPQQAKGKYSMDIFRGIFK